MDNESIKKSGRPQIGNVNSNELTKPRRKDKGQKELDAFVKNRRDQAIEYLKLLKEEITKTDRSRTRHIYAAWLMVGMFLLLDSNLAQLRFEVFEKLDSTVLLKVLPAAIMASYYLMMSRAFVARERLGMYDALSVRLFPGKFYPFDDYIRPTHFMLSERLLNAYRPRDEIPLHNGILALIVSMTMYGPAIAGIYAYYVTIKRYSLEDGLESISASVGLICFLQALVVLRGMHLMARQDREGGGRLLQSPKR